MIDFLYKAMNRSPIHLQLNSFFEWKAAFCPDVLEHKERLTLFVKTMKVEDACDIQHEQVTSYLNNLKSKHTAYVVMSHMKTIRSFLNYSYRRGYRCINPKLIRIKENGDIMVLKNVGENARMVLPNMQKPLGRPANVEYIEKVKLLKDQAKLSFRQIAKAINKDVSQVYVWYTYPMDKLSKRKAAILNELSTGKALASSLRK